MTKKSPPKKKKASLASVGHVFKSIIWPRRKLLIVGLILIVINRLAGLILPWASKYLIDDVIAEVAGLANQGVREITLLGQNVNAYRGEMHDDDVADLGSDRLVAAMDRKDRCIIDCTKLRGSDASSDQG